MQSLAAPPQLLLKLGGLLLISSLLCLACYTFFLPKNLKNILIKTIYNIKLPTWIYPTVVIFRKMVKYSGRRKNIQRRKYILFDFETT